MLSLHYSLSQGFSFTKHISAGHNFLFAMLVTTYLFQDGYTSLIWASMKGYFEVVKFLIENSANIDHADNVSIYISVSVVNLISIKYSIPTRGIQEGKTSLIRASSNGHIEIVRFLVDKSANINHADNVRDFIRVSNAIILICNGFIACVHDLGWYDITNWRLNE